MSIQLFAQHRCCNDMFYWRRSVESLPAVYIWVPPQPRHQRPSGLAMLLYRYTTGGPPRRRIQTAFGGGHSRRQLCKRPYAKNAAGAQGIQELSMSFTWPLSTHGDQQVWYLDGSPKIKGKWCFCICGAQVTFPMDSFHPAIPNWMLRKAFCPT